MNFSLEHTLGPTIGTIGYAIEVVGVIIIVVGFLSATVRHLANREGHAGDERYRAYRRGLAQSMMLGLEFLVAGDIIRTVVASHTFEDISILGLVVIIRTILVFTIHLELEGRWPWQSEPTER